MEDLHSRSTDELGFSSDVVDQHLARILCSSGLKAFSRRKVDRLQWIEGYQLRVDLCSPTVFPNRVYSKTRRGVFWGLLSLGRDRRFLVCSG